MKTVYILNLLAVFLLTCVKSGVQGLDWPWNWKREDITCYTTCLAAVGTGAVVGTPLAIAAAGFGATGIAAGSIAAKIMSMVGVVKAGSWFAFLQSAGVAGIGTTGKMILASTVAPLCAAICGKSDDRQDLKCYTKKLDGMKGLDEYVLKAEPTKSLRDCEILCEDMITCMAFRFIPKNNFCFLYSIQQYTEDDIESQFYTKRCILCYMNSTKDSKGPDDEIDSVWEVSSFEECEGKCMKSDDCKAVHLHGSRCFKFKNNVTPAEKTGNNFSAKICVLFNDIALEYEDNKYKP